MGVAAQHRKLRHVLARRVRDERLNRNWSQEHLAELAGLTQVYISNIESGNRAVSVDVLEALAHAFKMDAAALILTSGGARKSSRLRQDTSMRDG